MRKFTFIIVIAIALFSCENKESDVKALSKKNTMINEADNVVSYLSQGGKIKAKLTTPKMVRAFADTPYAEFPKTLHVDFFNAQKAIESKLDSKYGKYFESLNKIYLKDSVRVISTKGDTLLCNDLWWDQNKELFYSDKPVKLKRPFSDWIKGEWGIEATQKLDKISFKNAQGRVTTNEGTIPQ